MKFKIKSPLKFDHTTSSVFSKLTKITNVSTSTSLSKNPNTTGYNLDDTVYVDGVQGTVTGIAGADLVVTFGDNSKSTITMPDAESVSSSANTTGYNIDDTVYINGAEGTVTGIAGADLVVTFGDGSKSTIDSTAIYTVTVSGDNGTQFGAGIYTEGETVRFSANPDSGYTFNNWEVNNASLNISSVGTVIQQINQDIYGKSANDLMGTGESVALSSNGNIMAVGAPRHDGNNGSDSGHVRIYENINGTWTQVGSDIYGPNIYDNFGQSVELSSDGSIVAIGSLDNYSWSPTRLGVTQIYQRDVDNTTTGWTQLGSDIFGEEISDWSGSTIDFSSDGSSVAIGSPHNDDGGTSTGHARVFDYDNTSNTWTQVGATIIGQRSYTEGATSVALNSDGSIFAMGTPKAAAASTEPNNHNHGDVRVFRRDATNTDVWTQIGVDIDGSAGGDMSGTSIALSSSGSIVAIGSPQSNRNGLWDSGHVQVFENINETWTQVGSDIEGDSAYDKSGSSVEISSDGSIVAIGTPFNDENGNDSGRVRLYQNINGTWTQLGSDINGSSAGDESGTAIALNSNGTIVAIGSPNHDQNGDSSGQVRAYQCLLNTSELTMPAQNVLITANYTKKNYTVTIDGVNGTQFGGGTYQIGDTVSLSASPASGYEFTGWTVHGGGVTLSSTTNTSVTFTMPPENVSIVASYRSLYYEVTVDGLNGSPTGAGTYRVGDTVLLTADPDTGWEFDSWTVNSGGVTISDDSFTLPYENVSITANYTMIDYTVTINGSNGTQFGEGIFNYGDQVVVASIPDSGYVFDNWTSNSPTDLSISYSEEIYKQVAPAIQGEATYDRSGYAVALSSNGTIMAIGADWNDGAASSAGHVRIYKNIGGTWTQLGSDIDGAGWSSYFGHDLALSSDGSIVAIGGWGNDSNSLSSNGYAQVYEYDNTSDSWTQVGQDIVGLTNSDNLGRCLDLNSDGSVLAVGVPGEEDENGVATGAVRVFEYDNTSSTWTQIGSDMYGEGSGDQFGRGKLELSSNGYTVAIGALWGDNPNTNESVNGYVHVYEYDNTSDSWTQVGSTIYGTWATRSGTSLSLNSDGTILAIGAPYYDPPGESSFSNSGQIRVFERDDANATLGWTQIGSDIYGEEYNDLFGRSVELNSDGSILAAGGYDNTYQVGSGVVRVYENIGGTWTKIGIDIFGEASGDESGAETSSIALNSDGNIMVIGANSQSNSSGYTRVFEKLPNGGVFTMPAQNVSITANISI